MKKTLLSILFVFICSSVCAYASGDNTERRERNCIKQGNEAYRAGDYDEAETWYKEALQYNPTSTLALYNLALTVERQHPTKSKSEMEQQPQSSTAGNNAADDLYSNQKALFSKVTELSRDKVLQHNSYYNLGNIAFREENYAEAIEYYKQALRIDETNMKTRQNLRIAQLKLQQQNQGGSSDDQQEQEEKDDQQQDNQQQQQQEQNQQQQEQNQQDQQQNQQQPQQQTNGNQTNQNAEQILEAARKQEAQTRKDIERRQNNRSTRTIVDKPW